MSGTRWEKVQRGMAERLFGAGPYRHRVFAGVDEPTDSFEFHGGRFDGDTLVLRTADGERRLEVEETSVSINGAVVVSLKADGPVVVMAHLEPVGIEPDTLARENWIQFNQDLVEADLQRLAELINGEQATATVGAGCLLINFGGSATIKFDWDRARQYIRY